MWKSGKGATTRAPVGANKVKDKWRSSLCGAFDNLATLEQFKLIDHDTVRRLSTQNAKAEKWWL